MARDSAKNTAKREQKKRRMLRAKEETIVSRRNDHCHDDGHQ